jgi:hypothetical protein
LSALGIHLSAEGFLADRHPLLSTVFTIYPMTAYASAT